MSSVTLHRRVLLANAAAALAAWPAAAQAPQVGERRVVHGIGFLRAATPPPLVQRAVDLQKQVEAEGPVMERSDVQPVRDLRDYLDRTAARAPTPMRKLELVNLYVNRNARQLPDQTLYLRNDFWAPPLNTLLIGGDCEDFVLLKAWALKRLGFDDHGLYLVGGVSLTLGQPVFHAVLAVSLAPGRSVILDSLSNAVHPDTASAKFEPAYVLNRYGYWRVEAPSGPTKQMLDDINRQSQPVRLPPSSPPRPPSLPAPPP